MASLDEIAIGIATALASIAPKPLPVQLRGQTIDEAAYLVRAVVRECADAGIHLHRVLIDAELHRWLAEADDRLLDWLLRSGAPSGQALFFRRRHPRTPRAKV